MPDVSIKVFHGTFPSGEETKKMKLGEKLLWIPSAEQRSWGCTPVLYIVEKMKTGMSKGRIVLMPHYPLPLHFHG